MNNEGKTFRSAIGGYNREDVNEYIKNSDLKYAAELDSLKKAVDAAKAESEGFAAAVQTAIAERDGARERAHADMIAAAELTKAKDGEIAELTKRCNLLKAESDAQVNVINSLREEKAELSTRLEENEAAAVRAKKEAEETIRAVRAELTDLQNNQETAMMALRAENEALTGTLNEAVNESVSLRETAAALNARIADLEARLNSAHEEIAQKNAELAEKQAELNDSAAKYEEALAQCVTKALGDASQPGSDAYKLEMYDKVSSQLGDILIGANRNADDILNAAKANADQLRADTEQECEQKRADTDYECEQKRAECDAEISRTRMEVEEEASYIRERLSTAAGELLSSVSTDLHANTENCIREMAACVEDMQYEIKALLARLTSRSAEMNDRIDYYQNCVTEGVGTKLSEMDEKYGIKPLTAPADGESNAGE